ncbi:MAG: insulinase family protein [Candidatus Obscuribacterales bacterium]|nr:insulinase family protein [Steroidobacteraceae bacterium]
MDSLTMQTFTHRFAIALLSFSVLPLAHAQQTTGATGPDAQSVKGAQLKGKAPINSRSLSMRLPKPVEAQLQNGLRVVLIEDHKLPTLFIQCVLLERGDAADARDQQSAARATAAQLREGTASRTGAELSEQLDALGGSLNGASGTLDSSLTVTGLSEHLDPLLSIFADVLLHPSFPSDELERYKTRYISQLQAQRAQPGFMAREQLYKTLYGDHPAGTLAPTDEQVKKISAADLKAFHARFYRPNGALLLVAGDVTMKQLLPKLEKAFGEWQPSAEQPPALPVVADMGKPQVFVVDRPGSVQTSLLMGTLGIKGNHADRAALGVMSQVLGASAASRLFMNLREDKGYTYGAYSSVSLSRYPGLISANAEVRTEVTEAAMHEFIYELKRIASEPVGDVELANAKRAIVGRFALSLEEPRNFIGNVFEQIVYKFPADYWDHYAERVDAITASEVQRVAKKYLDLSRLQIVAVGDASKIRRVMDQFKAPAN